MINHEKETGWTKLSSSETVQGLDLLTYEEKIVSWRRSGPDELLGVDISGETKDGRIIKGSIYGVMPSPFWQSDTMEADVGIAGSSKARIIKRTIQKQITENKDYASIFINIGEEVLLAETQSYEDMNSKWITLDLFPEEPYFSISVLDYKT